jgi:hypothetical protein
VTPCSLLDFYLSFYLHVLTFSVSTQCIWLKLIRSYTRPIINEAHLKARDAVHITPFPMVRFQTQSLSSLLYIHTVIPVRITIFP